MPVPGICRTFPEDGRQILDHDARSGEQLMKPRPRSLLLLFCLRTPPPPRNKCLEGRAHILFFLGRRSYATGGLWVVVMGRPFHVQTLTISPEPQTQLWYITYVRLLHKNRCGVGGRPRRSSGSRRSRRSPGAGSTRMGY